MDGYSEYMKIGMKIIDERDTSITNYVVILDIDDTIIDSHTNKKIESIDKLYQYALENKIATVFITAREGTEFVKKMTIEQLKNVNIRGYDLLYFLPPYMKNNRKMATPESVEKYKYYARKNVTECGYTPLFSIGDMYWDVESRWDKDNTYIGTPILLKK